MKRSALSCALLAALLAACGSVQKDWDRANATGTVAAYQEFMQHHPSDAHAQEARSRIGALEDAQAWGAAQMADTAEAYQQYLQSQPSGAHVQEARDKIVALEEAAAWKLAQADGSAAALQGFLTKYPQGADSDQARAQLQLVQQPASGYRAQLGAFRSKKQAEHLRVQLRSRYLKLLHDIVLVAPAPPDKLIRVRSASMSRADARAACAHLKKAHQHCEVVKG
jgi:outer membrane protein assembly factor BamD (BamD/ComL family)